MMVSCEAEMDRERGAREGEAGIGSAGDGQEGLRDRQTGTGRGEGETNSEEEGETETDRQTHTHTNTHTHWYPLISQVISFPGATLPWAYTFPTLGQNPQPLTFRVGWLVPHNFSLWASLPLSLKVCPILHHQNELLLSYSYPEPIQ